MKKPRKEDFGYVLGIGWTNPNGERYFGKAMCKWETRPRKSGGRQRTRPIHPSWEPVLKHFDSTDPKRSQGEFCRWAGLNRGTFSAMQCKSIPMHIAELVGAWAAQGKEVESE